MRQVGFWEIISSAILSGVIATYAYRMIAGADPNWTDHVNLWIFGTTTAVRLALAVCAVLSKTYRPT